MKDIYFRELRNTSKRITPLILKYLWESGIEEPALSKARAIPDKRAEKPRLRDFILRLSYEISEGDNWEKIIPPYAAAIEIYNCSTYTINWFLDGKGNLQTKEDEKNAVNAGFLLRELAQNIIEKEGNAEDYEIIKGLSDVNFKIYQGQNLDLNELVIEHFDNFQEQEIFLNKYYEKGRLFCGYFLGWIAECGNLLAKSKDEEVKKNLYNFGVKLGQGLQLVNETGDFVPPNKAPGVAEKDYKDQVTDIINGRLTLPIWYVLKNGTQKQKDFLLNLVGNYNLSMNDLETALRTIIDSGAYDFAIMESVKVEKEARQIVHKLPESPQRDLLSCMCSIIRTNKFYVNLRKEKIKAKNE